MKTNLHHYLFNLDTPEGKLGYAAMKAQIEANAPEARGHWMNAHNGGRTNFDFTKPGTTEEVVIEPAHLFENQWNTAPNGDGKNAARVFDWYEEALFDSRGRPVKCQRRGHWLEITPEMSKARSECHKCGYCGTQYGPLHTMPVPADGFCPACLDSPYLKETELHLLRLLPLVGHQERAPLDAEERAALMPRYVSRQTTGSDSRAAKARAKERADVLKKYERETNEATIERDGMLWLWDKGFALDNVIYYGHTNRFGFGWRQPVSPAVKSKLLEVMSEFPFNYEIKATDGNVDRLND